MSGHHSFDRLREKMSAKRRMANATAAADMNTRTPMEILHDVVSVKPLDGYRVDVVFDNGEKAVFDCSKYLDKPYWRRLKDKAFFDLVSVGYGTLVWPKGIDIGPEDVWEFAVRYT